jgi:hypothetical protein
MTPRAYTPDECREKLLFSFCETMAHWLHNERAPTTRDKMEGMLHSMLATLDGCRLNLPMFIVTPSPARGDKAFAIGRGENWWPTNKPDLGPLHEYFGKALSNYNQPPPRSRE